MKKISILLLALLLLLFIPFPVSAHPGSLDANGGHWDRSAGTYHYHSGLHTESNNSYSSSSSSFSSTLDSSYQDGYDDGLAYGKTRGYGDGYDEGLKEGYARAQTEAEKKLKGKISWWWALLGVLVFFYFRYFWKADLQSANLIIAHRDARIQKLEKEKNNQTEEIALLNEKLSHKNADISRLQEEYNNLNQSYTTQIEEHRKVSMMRYQQIEQLSKKIQSAERAWTMLSTAEYKLGIAEGKLKKYEETYGKLYFEYP